MARDIRRVVRERYGGIARGDKSCRGASKTCCGSVSPESISVSIGYTNTDTKAVPEGANMGLGCGNPVALASLREGETVLDLGAGGGFDCFLAAKRVGKTGNVIGVDMTPEMLEKARANATKGKYANVEFRLGEIENLPVADRSVDVVISNCVINLSPDKGRVFKEAYRVLRKGGRLMVSDIVLKKELPKMIKKLEELYTGCIAGAMMKGDYITTIEAAGFREVSIVKESKYSMDPILDNPKVKAEIKRLRIRKEDLKSAQDSALSVNVFAVKG
jgi:ubiquinone/menaquinone biosynthesis C-methylase UbiE